VYEVQSILLRYGGHVLKKTPVVVGYVKKKIEEHKQREIKFNFKKKINNFYETKKKFTIRL
jgi:hypothetical protein